MKISDYNRLKRCLVFFLAVILVLPVLSMPVSVHAASFSDIRDHWAASYINTAVNKGFVAGYPDGTFIPDKSVTRAEFTSMINKALGNTGTASISFTDVPYSEWYYKEVVKGTSAAFVGGYDDNTFRPNDAVTRQEAAVMISRFIPTYGSSANLKTYSDSSSVSDWATSAMSKVCGKGYMGAYKDGQLHPLDNLTRAQTAKILCDILDSETIVSGTTTVRTDGTTLSNRIYANDVVLHADLDDGEATLSNCIVLGTLYVYGGGDNTVTVKNSRIANALVEKTSSSVRLLAQGESVVANATTGKTAILETSGLSGGLYGTGFNLVKVKGSADATLKGSFVRVHVIGSSAKVDLASGAISVLNVESAGKNSNITVANSASISTTNVNGAAAFHGSGSINTMNANTSGITYETKPKYVKASNSSYNPNVGSSASSTINGISISPKKGATDVDVDTKITLTFDGAATKYSGSTLTNSYIEDVIQLRKKTDSGTKVSFSASINSAKKVITITPDNDLDEDTKYYVVIDKNEFKFNDSGNSEFSSYFTTGDSSSSGVTFSPRNNDTGVNRSVSATISFSKAVETYAGKTATDSYIEDSVINFREGSSSGSKVAFSASINSSKKTITIYPNSALKEGQKYYLAILTKTLRTQSGSTNIPSSSVTWTVVGAAVDTSSINTAITSATTAKSGIQTSSNGSDIYTDIYWVSQAQWDALNSAITVATNAKSTVTTLAQAQAAANTLNTAVTAFNAAKQAGTRVHVDTSLISTALTEANTALSDTSASTDGFDVSQNSYWVTQDAMNTFSTAINTAKNAINTVQNETQSFTAAMDLKDSTTAFKSQKQSGNQADKSLLSAAIKSAQLNIISTPVSADGTDISSTEKWVSQTAKDAYEKAIYDANIIAESVTATQASVDSAKLALDASTVSFENSKQNGTKVITP